MGFSLGNAIQIGTGLLGFQGGREQNAANAQQAAQQMQFQERMSTSAHQREVSDLKAAGLNPMLSAKLGGASSPGGAQARMENTATAGSAAAINSAQMANLTANTRKTNAEAKNIEGTSDTTIGSTNIQNRGLIEKYKLRLGALGIGSEDEGRLGGQNWYQREAEKEMHEMKTSVAKSILMLDANIDGLPQTPLVATLLTLKAQFKKENATANIQQKEDEWWKVLKAVTKGGELFTRLTNAAGIKKATSWGK